MGETSQPTKGSRSGVGSVLASPAVRQVAVIAAVSLLLRTWSLSDQLAGNPMFQTPVLDDAVYLDAAQDLIDGAPSRAWFLAPLYPWLLWLLATVTGAEQVTLAMAGGLSIAFGVATSAVLVMTARDVAGARAGWIAGLLHAGAGAFVFQDLIAGQEAVLSLLYASAVLCAVTWYRTRSWWSVAAFGAAVGLAALGRGTTVLLLPAALPLVFAKPPEALTEERRDRRRALLSMAVALVGALVVLLPAAVRNQSVTGDLTPFTWTFGPNLYAANSPQSRALGTYHTGDLGTNPIDMERNARRIAERRTGRELRPSEISSYWRDRTIDELDGFGDTLSHVGTKLLLLFTDHPFGTSHALTAESRFSRWLRLVPGGEWWILAIGVFGWWMVRPRHPIADVIALAAVLTGLALVVLYPANRYRLGLLVVSTVLSGAGIAWFAQADKRRRGIAVALALAVAVAAQVIHQRDVFPHMYADSRTNVGRMLLQSGRAREAVAVLREADRLEPGSTVVLGQLAAALDATGDHAAAARAGGQHNRLIDALPAGRVRLLLDLAERGRRDPAALSEAERQAEELLPTLLNDDLRARLWANMALVAALRGDVTEADLRLSRARDLDPDLPHLSDIESRMPR